jgi:large subunit ribosomal protein L10
MRAEKKYIGSDYVARLNASPFFIIVDYRGLAVSHFTELRKRLTKAGAEIHVVKNSIFRIAAKEAGGTELTGELAGQLAMVTGSKDVSVAAKVLKTFKAEFEKPKVQFGFLGKQRLEAAELAVLADLPSMEVLRAKIVGLLNTPATRVVQVLSAPAQQLVRVIQAHAEKGA